jgi:16S rRNA processing protein RimM
MKSKDELLQVAKLGRLVGLKGEMKLHISSDFPEQFKKGESFLTDKDFDLEIFSYNKKRNLISFKGFQDRDSAQRLVNLNLFTTLQKTNENCSLKENEFFWFDVIDSLVKEDKILLGVVKDIQRLSQGDYLIIKTDKELIDKGLAKEFFVPYIDRYILSFDKDEKIVYTKDAYLILESS